MLIQRPCKKIFAYERFSPWLWFIALYVLGIVVTAMIAYGGRWLIHL
ncbi:MAG: hypothetical protein ACX932_01770 [Gammaproteobacteria bacterium]